MLSFDKNINIQGSKFDETNLLNIINRTTKDQKFSNINKGIEIDLDYIIAPLSEGLRDFKLIGKIEKGKFVPRSLTDLDIRLN